MSHIDDLIAELCPNGVEHKTLGDIGVFVRGNGMPKTDFTPSGVGAIHYGQIYTYYGTWTTETISYVSPETARRLAKVAPGDVIITNTSENLEDVGKAVAWLGADEIVTGGHASILKHSQEPKFIAYWLQSPGFQLQKRRLATGTKVIDVSAKSLATVRIPVPPLEVQREIVRVLDLFTSLEAEMEAELEARRAQFTYYRDALLTFDRDSVSLSPIGDVILALRTGLNPRANFKLNPPGATNHYITVRELDGTTIKLTEKTDRVDDVGLALIANRSKLKAGDVLFSGTGTIGRTALVPHGPLDWNIKEGVYAITPDHSKIMSKYLIYILGSGSVVHAIEAKAPGSTVASIPMAELRRISIPVPPLEQQERIVGILDRFDALVNDIAIGLPAELAARRMQYEYYRDRLLTFPEATA